MSSINIEGKCNADYDNDKTEVVSNLIAAASLGSLITLEENDEMELESDGASSETPSSDFTVSATICPPVLPYEEYLTVEDLSKRFVARLCHELETKNNDLFEEYEHSDPQGCTICIPEAQCACNKKDDELIDIKKCFDYEEEKGIVCSSECICVGHKLEEDIIRTCFSDTCICQEAFEAICWAKDCSCFDCQRLGMEVEIGTIEERCQLDTCGSTCVIEHDSKCPIGCNSTCNLFSSIEKCVCLDMPEDIVLVDEECICDKLVDGRYPCNCWFCPFDADVDDEMVCTCFKVYNLFTVKTLNYLEKPPLSLLDDILKWPAIQHFNINITQRHIELFVLLWNLNPLWDFYTNLAQENVYFPSAKYIYEVIFSLRTYKYPVPQATASVYFEVDVSYIVPPETPIEVAYRFEGKRYSYKPSDCLCFQENLLRNIIDQKIRFFKFLGVYEI